MILHDAATLFVTLIDTAVLWAEALTAAAVFVLCVTVPAGVLLVAPRVHRPAERPPTPVRRRRVPSWAHTEPYDYEEAA